MKKDKRGLLLYVPAFKLGAHSRERFVIKLPPETLELMAVSKTVDGRLPRAIVDTSALTEKKKQESFEISIDM